MKLKLTKTALRLRQGKLQWLYGKDKYSNGWSEKWRREINFGNRWHIWNKKS